MTSTEPRNGVDGTAGMSQNGTTSGLRPGADAGCHSLAPIEQAERLGANVRDLVVAEGLDDQDLMARRARVGIGGEVLRVALGLAAVPQQLELEKSSCSSIGSCTAS